MKDTATTTTSPPSSIVNIVFIGCGQIVTHHMEALFGSKNCYNNNNQSNHFQCHLLAVCDPSKERRDIILQERVRIEQDTEATTTTTAPLSSTTLQFNTLEELIEYSHAKEDNAKGSSTSSSTSSESSLLQSIDIILIAVPHDLHTSIAIRALEVTEPHYNTTLQPQHPLHTTWVVLEKPIAITITACEQLRHATIQYQYQSRLIIAEQSPYWPAVIMTQSLISQIGNQIISIASYYYESMRDNVTSGSVEATTGNLGWRGSIQRSGGGIMMDGGLHWIRPIREIACHSQHEQYRISKVLGVTCPVPSIQTALGMEGETLGHALFELTCGDDDDDDDDDHRPSDTAPLPPPIIATYSACMLPSPAVMAYDACPYVRITGTTGEIIISGTGLQKHVPNAGGVRLYNPQYPNGKEMLLTTNQNNDNNEEMDTDENPNPSSSSSSSSPRTDFFMAFYGLWNDIHRIRIEGDGMAAYETVDRAIDDVATVLALYKSAQTRQWELV